VRHRGADALDGAEGRGEREKERERSFIDNQEVTEGRWEEEKEEEEEEEEVIQSETR
jgi:hypothetical protein